MLNITAEDISAAKPLGGSARLMAHRLATFDAEQAKRESPKFQEAWAARRSGTASVTPGPVTSAPVTPITPVATAPVPDINPPIAASTPSAVDLARAAAIHSQIVTAQANAEVEKQRAAQEAATAETARRRAAADAVWNKVNGFPADAARATGGTVDPKQAAADSVWDRAWASSPRNGHLVSQADTGELTTADRPDPSMTASDLVWAKAHAKAGEQRQSLPTGNPAAHREGLSSGQDARSEASAVWDRVNAKREALYAHMERGAN
ncbi:MULTISPECIES: hypothetical protein [unclassified Sphingobium]|uniref:hypothetical protein n=1 Tax=unclassified Sphingobium TaxID=2611147 RepID=UPI000D151C8E|nr:MULTISPECIES: hypothetical protein [unclassified Sphingobium]PSO12615.1 hypothetical protein C7E20_05770 [Sphingobium sp. AEW4]TWD09794.1 hypothetical protein FB595_104141 [Sphingobium sp. AEW010]TWD26465.1 hypothetical protein FB596_104141 [Sphingobium sp. AEW013]TWD27766.1 hypothetical protein FB594_105187 [Sphingobium sp. AEW001]